MEHSTIILAYLPHGKHAQRLSRLVHHGALISGCFEFELERVVVRTPRLTTFYIHQTESPGGRYKFEAPVDKPNWLVAQDFY